MNRDAAIEAGAHALVRWVDDGEGWGDMEPEEQDDARTAAAAVIDAAAPHLTGEPVGWTLSLEAVDRIVQHLLADGTRDGLILADVLNQAMGRSARRLAARGTPRVVPEDLP